MTTAKQQELVGIPKEIVLSVLSFLGGLATANPAARITYNALQTAFTDGLKPIPLPLKERPEPGMRRKRPEQLKAFEFLVKDVAIQCGVESSHAQLAGQQAAAHLADACGGRSIHFPAQPEATIQWLAELKEPQ